MSTKSENLDDRESGDVGSSPAPEAKEDSLSDTIVECVIRLMFGDCSS